MSEEAEPLDDFFDFDDDGDDDLDLDEFDMDDGSESDAEANVDASTEVAESTEEDDGVEELEDAPTENGHAEEVDTEEVDTEEVDTEDGDVEEETAEEAEAEEEMAEEVVGEDEEGSPIDDIDIDWDPDGEDMPDEDELVDGMEAAEDEDVDVPKNLVRALRSEGIEATEFDVDEAAQVINDAEGEFVKHQNQIMRLRWRQGLIAAATPIVHGEQTMENLAEKTGVHTTTLYKAQELVEHFLYDKELYEQWLSEGDNGTRLWKDALAELKDDTDMPDDPDKQDEKREEIIEEITAMAHKIDQVTEMIKALESPDEELKRELEGLKMRAMEEIQRFTSTAFYETGEVDTDNPTPRSEKYLEFIRSCPCAISEKPGADPHHVDQGGVGMKGSDLTTVPLHRKLHDELEDMPDEKFEEKYGIDFDELQKAYLHRFITGQFPENTDLPEPKGW